jgi:PAS domain S-box-containing protein
VLQAVVFDSKGIIDPSLKNKLENIGISLSQICQYDKKAILLLTVKKPDLVVYLDSANNCDFVEGLLKRSNDAGIPSIFIITKTDENLFTNLENAHYAWYIKEPFDENELCYVVKKAFDHYAKASDLKEKEESYKSVFKNSTNGFALHEIVTDENGKPVDYIFLEANKAFGILTGLDNESIIGQRVTEVLPGIDKETSFIEIYGTVALSEQTVCFSEYVPQLDRYYEVCAYSTRKGEFATIFTDVTKIRKAEEDSKQNEKRLRSIIENTDAGYFFIDSEGVFRNVNDAWLRMYGYSSKEEIIGKHFMCTQIDKEINEALSVVEKLMRGEQVRSGEFTRLCKDGSL